MNLYFLGWTGKPWMGEEGIPLWENVFFDGLT